MKIPNILVTGANGQLGNEIRELSALFHFRFYFAGREECSLTKAEDIDRLFRDHQFEYCINCAAYTAVDQAETDSIQAHAVNAEGVKSLATACKRYGVKLLHISTDYVYDSNTATPLRETDPIGPLNVYGTTKLHGEQFALQIADAVVIRTSWVYSTYAKNFVKTMLRLFETREKIQVVADQCGSPTYARDLAMMLLVAIEQMEKGLHLQGVYNFSNGGSTTWHAFAQEIKYLVGASCLIDAVSSAEYPTPAKRPKYSVLDTSKIQQALGVTIAPWKDSLREMLEAQTGRLL